jgi:hypothetical protein
MGQFRFSLASALTIKKIRMRQKLNRLGKHTSNKKLLIVVRISLILLFALTVIAVTAGSQIRVGGSNDVAAIQERETSPAWIHTRENNITKAVADALRTEPPEGYARIPPGTRLISVKINKGVVTLNFSKELTANSTKSDLEDAIHQILAKIADITPKKHNVKNYIIQIEGRPLEEFRKSHRED